jgi:hypothetical protein
MKGNKLSFVFNNFSKFRLFNRLAPIQIEKIASASTRV